jgi:hypothetical protein
MYPKEMALWGGLCEIENGANGPFPPEKTVFEPLKNKTLFMRAYTDGMSVA